jgi:hypothetical protein
MTAPALAQVIPFPSLDRFNGGGKANTNALAFLLAISLIGERDAIFAALWPHLLRRVLRECPEVAECIERVGRESEGAIRDLEAATFEVCKEP